MTDVTYSADRQLRERRFRPLPTLIGAVILSVIIILALLVWQRIHVQHDIVAARTVTDAMLIDVQEQDAYAARALGDEKFQQTNSVAALASQFKQIHSYTNGASATSYRSVVRSTSSGKAVSVFYRYSSTKPYYIRLTAVKHSGYSSWKIVNLLGANNENKLLQN